jgi:hypothetical protein
VDRLKVLDPKRPIREADIVAEPFQSANPTLYDALLGTWGRL